MDSKAILEQLLAQSRNAVNNGVQAAEERRFIPPQGDERTAMLKGAGAGALAAGAVAMFMGNKGSRKFLKKAAKFGGTAALGGLAYKVYADMQTAQNTQPAPATGTPIPAADSAPSADPIAIESDAGKPPLSLNLAQFENSAPIDELAEPEAQQRSESVLRAMITAARADGHIDSKEMDAITQEISALGLEQDVSRFLLDEMNKPVDAERIAGFVDSPEAGAELYIASAMVIDQSDAAGRDYLGHLAAALGLSPSVVALLEAPLKDES